MHLQKSHKRCRLLLDEGLPPKEKFPKLNNLHTLRHINHDLKKSGAKDAQIYKLAKSDKYDCVIIFNTKDYLPLVRKNNPTVISLSTNLTIQQIDLKLCKVLKELHRDEVVGFHIIISNEGIIKKKIGLT